MFTRAETLPNAPRVVVIGEGLWNRRFGRDPNILGQLVDTGNARYTIIGVMPESFHFPDHAQAWFPIRINAATAKRTDYFQSAVARMKPGASVQQANDELRALLDQIHQENPATNNHWLIRGIPIRNSVAVAYRPAVITLLVAVSLLLLIACANVSNLLLVRASARVREMAVRTALGAPRRRLIRQLFTESVLLGLAGGILGVLLAYAGIPALLALVPIDLPAWMNFSPDSRVLAFALAVSMITAIGFGIAPAFGSLRVNLVKSLKEGSRGSSTGLRQKILRNGLVVAEVALSVLLLAGAGLMIRSFLALRGQDLGYRASSVLMVRLDYPDEKYPDGPKARALLQRVHDEIAPLPGISSVAFSSGIPFADGWSRIYTVEGRPLPLQNMPFANHVVVTPGFFTTLGVPLLAGRDFAETDYDGPPVLIVCQAFAKKNWPGENPIGKRIRFGPPANNEAWHTIVGIAADNRQNGLKGDPRSNVYLPYSKDYTPSALVIRASGDALKLMPEVRTRIVAIDRDIAIERVLTIAQSWARASWQDRFLTVLSGAFALLAMLLAAVGLYAVLSYTVSLNRQEIGIRMALGASAASVRSLVIRNGLALAAAGLVLGLAASLALLRLLQTQLFGITPYDPLVYVAAPAVFLVVAFLATYLPARRATTVDPMSALRCE